MTTIDDLLEFKYETPLSEIQEFEETVRTLNKEPWRAEIKELRGLVAALNLNKEPWRAEIKELRGLVAALSEQVTLLQKQVVEQTILPARTVTLYAGHCSSQQLLLPNGTPYIPPLGGQPATQSRPNLEVSYVMIEKGSGRKCGSSLSIAENGSGKIDIPRGYTLSILSYVWSQQIPLQLVDGTRRPRGPTPYIPLKSQPLTIKLRYEYSYLITPNDGEI